MHVDMQLAGKIGQFPFMWSQLNHIATPSQPLGADKGSDDGAFFRKLEERDIVPHVPLVKPPVDPATVRDKKRIPGIQAR